MEEKEIRLHPSSASFTSGASSDTQYNNGCYRFAVVKNEIKIYSKIPETSSAVGFLDERRFEEVLRSRGYEVEAEVYRKVEIAPGLYISGRRDFVCTKDGETVIFEKKSSVSKKKQSDIRHKRISEDQLAQLVTYMMLDKVPQGYLAVTMYHWSKDMQSLMVGAEIEHDVKIDGRTIIVNGEPYPKSVTSLARFYKDMAYYRKERKIGPRPTKANNSYNSPCNFCPLKVNCQKFDLGVIDEEYMLTEAPKELKEAIENEERKEPAIWRPKR